MDWVDKPQNFKGLYGILQGSYLDNFPLKTPKLGWVAFHSLGSLSTRDFETRTATGREIFVR